MLLEGKDSPPWTKNERSHSTSKRMWWMTPMYALLLRDRRNPSSCKDQTQIIIWSEQIQLDWTGSDQILMAHRWSFFQSCQMLAHRPLTSNSMTFKWNKTKSSQYTHTMFDFDLETMSVVPVFKLKILPVADTPPRQMCESLQWNRSREGVIISGVTKDVVSEPLFGVYVCLPTTSTLLL